MFIIHRQGRLVSFFTFSYDFACFAEWYTPEVDVDVVAVAVAVAVAVVVVVVVVVVAVAVVGVLTLTHRQKSSPWSPDRLQ